MLAVLTAARKILAVLSWRGRPRRVPAPALAALALAALAGCDPGAFAIGGAGPVIDTRAAVPVALLVPAGSGQASDAVLAQALENAARLAVSDLEGVAIDLRVYPTAGQPAQAAAAAARAVADGAKIVLGPVFGGEANAAGLAVAGRGINVLSFSNNADIAGGNVFVLGPTFANSAARLVRYARGRGISRLMVVHERTTAGEVGRDAIVAAAAAAGAPVTAVASFEFSQAGVVAAVPAIAGQARGAGAEALFLTADTAGALPLLTQLLSENGVSPEVARFIGLTRWDIPAATLALPGIQGGWFALPDPDLSQRFAARYAAAYGASPHPIAGLAYDGIAAIGALVRAGRGDALTREALTQPSGFVGTGGIFRFLADGTNERGMAVAEVRNAQVVVIDAAPRSFVGAGF
ncbi:MAG: ABC transporter substrate-binding protein [Rhodobacteraceae bacterium]|nr:ABC transporter substrate-binding protein [Paracoccaceae bacterium]